MAGSPGPVRAEASEGVLEITLDRPPANAVDVATSHALYEAFARLESDPDLRVGIVTAAGGRFFCAGWDLKAAAAGERLVQRPAGGRIDRVGGRPVERDLQHPPGRLGPDRRPGRGPLRLSARSRLRHALGLLGHPAVGHLRRPARGASSAR